MVCEQVSGARLREDEEEEPSPQAAGKGASGAVVTRPGTKIGAQGAGASNAGRPGAGADAFTVTDAPQEMDVNMEYKELAREADGDDEDPDVMLGTQPGGTLKNVAFRVRNRRVAERRLLCEIRTAFRPSFRYPSFHSKPACDAASVEYSDIPMTLLTNEPAIAL